MKKLLIIPALFLSAVVFSQEMKVHKTDGTVITYNISDISHLTFTGTSGIHDLKFRDAAKSFNLMKNYPNPFSASTTIRYELIKRGRVDVLLVDLSGRVAKTFSPGTLEPGEYNLVWDGLTDSGNKAIPGIYICQLRCNSQIQTINMIVIK